MTRFSISRRFWILVAGLAMSAAGSALAQNAAPPKTGDVAADFTLNAIDGSKVKLSDLTEKSPVVLVVLRGYPGYQCPICTAQVQGLISKASDLGDARVLMVYPGPADKLKERAEEFMKGGTLPENFTLVLDPDYSFTNQYHLRWNGRNETAYPSTFVIDKAGKIRFAKVSKSHGGRASIAEVAKGLAAARKAK